MARVKVPLKGAPMKGAAEPLVTLVVFSDFQCPFCSRVVPPLERLLRTYDDVAVAFRHTPLPFHKQAVPAAIVAEEARAQRGDEGFWAMHDALFESQDDLSRERLLLIAREQGLEVAKVSAALEEARYGDRIRGDLELAMEVGVRGTPATFVNGRLLSGARPFDEFDALVREERALAEQAMADGTPRRFLYEAAMAVASDEPEPEPEHEVEVRRVPDPDAIYRVPLGDGPVQGSPEALVTIVAFTDFECPFCARAKETVATLQERYGDTVRVAVRQNPLPFHREALPSAEAALEAFAQNGSDGFFAMHDKLFAEQHDLSDARREAFARELGLNVNKFRKAMEDGRHRARIDDDQALAQQLGARGTPAFFINGQLISGAQPEPIFVEVIERQKARAQALLEAGVSRNTLYETLIEDGARAPVTIEVEVPTRRRPAPRPQPERIAIEIPDDVPSQGPKDAPVVIQMFSDFECPFCVRALPTMDALKERFEGKLRFVYRNYPLPNHRRAMPAAIAAREVYEQAGDAAFFEYYALLFDNQRDLTDDMLVALASQIEGVNKTKVGAALRSEKHRARVLADQEAVRRAGARIGTPSFLINDQLVAGAQPLEVFEAAVNAALETE